MSSEVVTESKPGDITMRIQEAEEAVQVLPVPGELSGISRSEESHRKGKRM